MPDQSVFPDRVKAALKTALAMVLAYGVALSMDWHNPYWAGFAVVFCSLSTVGESLNAGLLRLSRTTPGQPGILPNTLHGPILASPGGRRMIKAAMTAKGSATMLPPAKIVDSGSPMRSCSGPVPNAATP